MCSKGIAKISQLSHLLGFVPKEVDGDENFVTCENCFEKLSRAQESKPLQESGFQYFPFRVEYDPKGGAEKKKEGSQNSEQSKIPKLEQLPETAKLI